MYTFVVILVVILFWLVCSIISYGLLMAIAQRIRPEESIKQYNYHRNIAIKISIFGPFVVLAVLFSAGTKYGFKLRKEEKIGSEWYRRLEVLGQTSNRSNSSGNYLDLWED